MLEIIACAEGRTNLFQNDGQGYVLNILMNARFCTMDMLWRTPNSFFCGTIMDKGKQDTRPTISIGKRALSAISDSETPILNSLTNAEHAYKR